jgi:hypothetical protein
MKWAHRKIFVATFGVVLTLTTANAHAEVRNFMELCPGQRLCPYHQIVLMPPQDWIEDKQATKENRVQVMVPRGRNFANADALMYVKVSVKQNDQSLSDFINVSQSRWRQSVPDTKIAAIGDVERANKQPPYKAFRYENPSRPQQRFEAVSFGEDKDKDGNVYYVMVALTGRDKAEIDRAMAPYQAFLRGH